MGVFLNGYERPDVVEYRAQFLKELEALGPYLVEFRDDVSIEEKAYPSDCAVNSPKKDQLFLLHMIKVLFRQMMVDLKPG